MLKAIFQFTCSKLFPINIFCVITLAVFVIENVVHLRHAAKDEKSKMGFLLFFFEICCRFEKEIIHHEKAITNI